VPLARVLASDEAGFTAVEDRDLLERAVRALPARERRIVGLRVYHDLTQAEIAAIKEVVVEAAKVFGQGEFNGNKE
jgi:DNA-directed RNA polymerase specialized sigma24 family protein